METTTVKPWPQEKINELRCHTEHISEEGLHELFDQAIFALKWVREAAAARAAFGKTAPPTRPKQVEQLGEWDAYAKARNQYDQQKHDLEQADKEAREYEGQIHLLVYRFLPTEVWFRHGDLGVGLSASNWGGYHTNLEVAEWSDNMPSLDKRYHGD